VKGFLRRYYIAGRPLLLGFSGGPDSTALLLLLQECSRSFPIPLHVAHLDHGWRDESAQEAEELKRRVEALGLPFHMKRIKTPRGGRNLEKKGREERLNFFSALCRQEGCQALLLAHQAEDQAETVLKRVLEGASLIHLGGMKEVCHLDGMEIWRPLLRLSKKEICTWLNARGTPYLLDPANEDERFLRGRMRFRIFPEIKKSFGKDAALPLGRVGAAAQELKEYLERRVAPFLKRLEKKSDGWVLDLNPFLPLEKIELSALVRILAQREGCFLSFEAVEALCKSINAKGLCKKKASKRGEFLSGRGVLAMKNLPQ